MAAYSPETEEALRGQAAPGRRRHRAYLGVWHYPLVLAGYQYPDDRLLSLFVFPVSCVLLSIVFGWLQDWAESVWAPSLAHAATNAVGGSLLTLLFLGGPNWIFASYLGVLGWVPLGALRPWVVLTGRPRAGRPR